MVSTITQLKLVEGCPDGTFQPDRKITRAELATVIAKFFEPTVGEKDMDFADVDKDAWYYQHVRMVSALGIMTGSSGIEFRPTDPVRRCEAMVTFNRLLDHRPMVDGLIEDGGYLNKWPNNANEDV